MATVIFRGDAQAIAQVDTITVANTWAQNDTVTLTINGKDLVLTVGSDVATTDVALGISEMVNGTAQTGTAYAVSETGDNVSEFDEITASVSGSVVSMTADTKGKPFTLSVTEVTAGDGTATEATATTSSGPNDWSIAENWSGGAVPVNADDVWIQDSDVDILYGLDQNAVTLTSLNITASYSGEIGLPYYDTAGDTPYVEYRQQYLKIGTSALTIGDKSGDFSGRVKIDLDAVQTAITMYGSDSSAEDNKFGAVEIFNSGASSTLDMYGGTLDVAPRDDDTATLATIILNAGALRCSSGVTLATVTQAGGSFDTSANLTTFTQRGGVSLIDKTATVGTFNLYGGGCNYRSSGTLTTLNMDFDNPTLTVAADARARTFTTVNLKKGVIRDPNETVTWTNGVQPERGVAAVI